MNTSRNYYPKKNSYISIFAVFFLVCWTQGCTEKNALTKSQPDTLASPTESQWPEFADGDARRYLQNCRQQLASVEQQFNVFETREKAYEAEQLLSDINDMDMIIDRTVNEAGLFSNVHPNAEIRSAAEVCEQKFVALLSEISLSRPLYNHLTRINASSLSKIDQRYLEHMLRDFRRSGVDKDQATRTKIRQLNEEINLIGQSFDKNIRDGGLSIQVDSVDQLVGLPEDFITAHQPDEQGKITITTNYPDYVPVMQYAHNDNLRRELYRVFRQQAYPANKEVLTNLVNKRHELASLLGYANTAEYVTEDKMIKSAQNAQSFIDKVSAIASPRANAEYQTLLARLKKIDPKATQVHDWQKMYLEELVKQEKYEVDSREIRQYFSYKNVRQGIFDLTQTMFGVTIKPRQTDTWHPSVEAYEIWDGGKVIGNFYLDMHPREGKYKHAAAFTIQSGITDVQLPVYALVCNFPGGEGSSGLMEHSDVETFLHEFGHLLHGIFAGDQPWVSFSGIKTEWDFVEAPSQMLQEWVWDAETLATFARNDKGDVIPKSLVNKMIAGRDFGRGLWTKHQLFYAALSLDIYNRDPVDLDLDKIMKTIQQNYSPFGYVEDTYFYTNFGHLNGYSAIYYTYMWSLVISADMFSEFEKHGLRNPDVAKRYRRFVLAPGGARDAADLVNDFLGRPYSFDAFAKDLKATH